MEKLLNWTDAVVIPPMLSNVLYTVGLLLAVFIITLPADLTQQALLGLFLYAFAIFTKDKQHRLFTFVLIVLSLLMSTRYMYWRVTESIIYESFWQIFFASGLFLAELYAFIVLILGYFQTIWPLDRQPVTLPDNPVDWPSVDVFIPTYNESLDVVRPTILAATLLEWPADKLHIYVLDDGRREEFAEFCQEVGVQHVTRSDNKHAKAGNINAALPNTQGDVIAIFDCDHIPARTFLKINMGFFTQDEKMALVQTPHHFYSPDPFERNLNTFRKVPNEGELFYGLLQRGNDFWNAAFFCGSCALIRRTMLEEVGGVAVETVTEDSHTALKLHALGYHSAFCAIVQAGGLATESVSAHVGQRVRWGRGMAQIFRINNPLLMRGLEWGQRLCYLNGMLHFFNGLPRIVFLTAPLAYIFFNLHIINADALLIAAFVLPHLTISTLANSRLQGAVRHSFWAEVYETVMSPYLLKPTTLALINPKLGTFNVTAKGGLVDREYFDTDIAKPLIFLLLLDVLGLCVALGRLLFTDGTDVSTLVLNLAWITYNTVIIAAALGVCMETKQQRSNHRIPVELKAMLRFEDGKTIRTKTVDMSEGGLSLERNSERIIEENIPVSVTVFDKHEEHVFEAMLVRVLDHRYCVCFKRMDYNKERELIGVIFCRPNTWQQWIEGRGTDKPMHSLSMVLMVGLEGIRKISKNAWKRV